MGERDSKYLDFGNPKVLTTTKVLFCSLAVVLHTFWEAVDMPEVRRVSVLVYIQVAFIPNAEIVERGEVGVHLKAGILMILPVLPVNRLMGDTK